MNKLDDVKVGDKLYVTGASYQQPYVTTVTRLTPTGFVVCEDGFSYRKDGTRRGNIDLSAWYAQPFTPAIAERIERLKVEESIVADLHALLIRYNDARKYKHYGKPAYPMGSLINIKGRLDDLSMAIDVAIMETKNEAAKGS